MTRLATASNEAIEIHFGRRRPPAKPSLTVWTRSIL